MHARQRNNAKTELRALVCLVGAEREWRKAREVAAEIGIPWRKVAFALRRLAKRGYVEQEIVTYRGEHRTCEYTTRYRTHDQKPVGQSFKDRYFSWIKL